MGRAERLEMVGVFMGNITLCKDYAQNFTIISNCFIDSYMQEANDAQIKIYLYLLRVFGGNEPVSVGSIADYFNYTEKDVVRALKYWDKKGVLSLSFNSMNKLTCIQLANLGEPKAIAETYSDYSQYEANEDYTATDSVVCVEEIKDTVKVVDFSEKPDYSIEQLAEFKSKPEIEQLLFIAETYLAKTLRPGEISSLLFMYDAYGFSADLIEYLVEYCANNKKKNIKYIEAVAKSWAETGITTVEEAKDRTTNPCREVYDVFNAFGIRGRAPIEPEISYVNKWLNNYGFSIDIICEACNRTIMSIHSASFEYADKILCSWKDASVHSIEDISELDVAHAKRPVGRPRKNQAAAAKEKQPVKKTSFNNFSQRKYDFDELERDALSN